MTISSVKKQAHFVAGRWIPHGQNVLISENPANGEVLWTGCEADSSIINEAMAAARAACAEWSTKDFHERQIIVERYAEVLQHHHEALALAIHLETGKPLWESKTEVTSMVAKIALSIKAYHQRTGTYHDQQAATGIKTQLTHRAHGVFIVLGPYNFPGHLPNGHLVPALLAGNTIVFKPSEHTPWVAELMLLCWQEAGLPAGVVNLVQGGRDVGVELVNHESMDGVLFTGSSTTGIALHRAMAGKPEKMLALEMGGNNPLVVDTVDDIDAAVYMIVQSAFISAGQRCTCARRLILTRNDNNERLLRRLVEVCAQLQVGPDKDSFMGCVINNAAAMQLLAVQEKLLSHGGLPLLPMQRLFADRPFLTAGLIDMTGAVREDNEYFGPLLQVIRVDDLAQAITEANATRYGLASGLLSDDSQVWEHFNRAARAGIVNWNRPLTGASGSAPFGGIGVSGNHRPSALYAADYSAYPVASMSLDKLALPHHLPPGIHI